MKKASFIALFCLLLLNLQAQNIADDLWTKSANLKSASINVLQRDSNPTKFDLYQLNMPLLKEKLKNAPSRGDSFGESNVIISFPNNKGILEDFQVMEASVMEKELQEKYPDIRSYIGKGIDHPGSIIRFSVTPLGLNGLLLSNKESDLLIDPYTKDRLNYMVYSQKDLPVLKISPENDIIDKAITKNPNILKSAQTTGAIPNDGKLRTFRLVLASSGEYSQYILTKQGISESATDEVKKATVLAALNTIITRVNVIYERDICLNMKLVANNEAIIFLDPKADGYLENPNADLIVVNQKNCDRLIGFDNYDIGHVIVYAQYGIGAGTAGLESVCTNSKAMGFTAMNEWTFVIAHEIGHAFGAWHTYNSCRNELDSEFIEPGCGKTIMSYGEENEANHFFHSISIKTICNNIMKGAGQCATLSETGNTPPVVNAGNDLTIPKSTPFLLEGQATDTDGNNSLTYSWEQIDAEKTSYPPVSFATAGPVFSWTPPSSSPNRYMPVISTIISGSLTSETEAVPSVSRVLNFNFVVRDNDPRGGQLAIAKKVITVDGNSGPFQVTSHKATETWYSGSTKTISWDVAGTNSGSINVQTVDILFSTDGGYTYPTILASNIPNDGHRDVVIPFGIKTNSGRFMVRAVGNIFFAINSADLTVDESPFLTNFKNKSVEICLPESTATFEFTYNTYLGYSGTTTFSANAPAGTSLTFNPTSAVTNGTIVKMTVIGITTANLGKNTISVTGTSIGNPVIECHENVILNVFNAAIPPITLLFPSNGSVNVSSPYVLTWNVESNAKTYTLELATDQSFANIIETATLLANSYNPSSLTINTEYYWRVKSNNPCGNGIYSGIYSFKTLDLTMFTYIPDDNFQNALREGGYDPDNVDDYIRTSVVKNIRFLDITNKNIYDLTGIQDFTKLDDLRCSGNHLKNLDLSKNIAITQLVCSNNELISLDLSNCNLFSYIDCSLNELTSLDLSNKSLLNSFRCSDNKLNSLDITNSSNIRGIWCERNQLTSIDLSKNTLLKKLYCSGNNFLNIDVTKNVDLIFFNCSENKFSSLDVTKNIKLKVLQCNNNLLNFLDVSKNVELTDLLCSENNLSVLNVTNNINVAFFDCASNKLLELDLTKNNNLDRLDCSINQLSNLDLTNNTELTYLSANGTNLTSLDLKNNPKLVFFMCNGSRLKYLNLKNGTNSGLANLNVAGNPNLACIQVDNATLSAGYQSWQKDARASYSEDCSTFVPFPTKTLIANAGVDQTINERVTVFLDGSASSHPDGSTLIYKWTAPYGITLSSNTAPYPAFIAPEVSANTNYTFSLVVNDGTVDSPVDHVVITVLNVNKAPISSAGTDQSVNEGATVTLDGTLSSDPDKEKLIYSWSASSTVMLSDTESSNPTFVAPEVKKDSVISFSLKVSDGRLTSAPATVKITVLNVIKVGNVDISAPAYKVYPNPTTGMLTLELTQNSGKKTEVSVSNLIGAEVFSKEFSGAANYQIDLSNQVSGIYLLKVMVDNQEYMSKIVIRKE